jgi:hypothetical protein
MRLKKIIPMVIAFLALPFFMMAQVTTSSISGTVKQTDGDFLSGATITAIHQPTGTKYLTVSKKGGSFTLSGLRPGGPYTISVDYVGYKQKTISDINLALGDDYNANVALQTSSSTLTEVVVSAKTSANVKAGVSTSVGQRQITTLPTISRSISDFTRLTPQANGNSVGGRDGRYNNVTVDGANLNNNFGLSTDPLPGGGNNPISLDAIEEVSVNIAPTDVRQSNFTGANIAAVTKSGTNTMKGSVYSYYRDQSFIGTQVGKLDLGTQTNSKTNIYGGTLGGAIIKNKLFFFVNAEYEKKTLPPGTNYRPTGGSASPLISNVKVDSLKKFSDYLRTTYGYETGAYDNFKNFESKNYKILAKIDWNLSAIHKVTAKYSELSSTNDVGLNSTSVPNSATTGANIWTSTARFGQNAFSFENSNYAFKDVVRSASAEINSNWKGKFSNQLIATYTKIQATRTTESALFPFIDIIGNPLLTGAASTYAGGARNNYMSAGKEPYSNNNDVKNNIFNITENFNYYVGKHAITVGGAYESQYVGNQFMAASQSYYTYGSLAEFMNPAARPIAFALTYSRVPGNDAPYAAELKYGQISLYAQDEVTVTPNLKVMYGIRADKPNYPTDPIENPAITALTFNNKDGVPTNYSTGKWPKATFYLSPRASFRWDVDGDKKLIVRGGSGIYTGRIPFVYLTNMPTNAGVYQYSALANSTQLSQITFNQDPNKWQSLFSTPALSAPTAGFVMIDKNYKFPQVWRTNAGFDQKFGKGITLSMDMMYTKDLNATIMRNANQSLPTSTVNLGGSIRPSFASTATTSRRVYSSLANAIVLENAKGGGSFSLTTQVSKAFNKGFYASLAYTYSAAMDYTANPGSTASSTWSGNATSGTQNDKELSYSNFAAPHRIVGTFSYRKEYFNHLATTFSLFYEGSQYQGGRISYIYGAAGGTAPTGFSNTADVNFDGNSSDLMYVPRNASEITFTPLIVGSGATAVTYTAQQQSDAFFAFVAQDKYLSKRMGKVAERNGGSYPFYHRVDASIRQDIFTNIGGKKNTLQITADCFNFLNLLNKDWGIRSFAPVFNPLRATKNATTGEVRYQLATYTPNGSVSGSNPILVDKSFINSTSTSSTWSLQLGLRYIF